jgi:hypothetical protein
LSPTTFNFSSVPSQRAVGCSVDRTGFR